VEQQTQAIPFNFQDTTATRKVFSLRKRIRAVSGGTSASKTISILVWLIDYCQTNNNKLASVVSESYPHLEKGAMLDFENIMKDRGYWSDSNWHSTKHTYTFETGSKLEFFSADTYGKAHGPRRDVLFVNEANNMEWKIVDQLIIRTRYVVWMDWNPSEEFWFYTDMLVNRTDVDFITLTYLDNEALDSVTVTEIESHKNNKAWWTVYGLGQLGEIEGRIYTGWRGIDEVPFEARLIKRGLDFGYTNDPSGLLAIYEYNGGFIFDEEMYQKGMGNNEIAHVIKSTEKPRTLVVGDSSEPKSINELKLYGINIIGANKGPGSINQGIAFIQSQAISYTKRSLNLIKEYRGYMWLKDKQTDRFINDAQDFNNHLLDPARYALESYMVKLKAGQVTKTVGAYRGHAPTTLVQADGRLTLNLDFKRAYGRRRR
jgi:phage terminase large subunit